MNGKDLLIGLGYINSAYFEEAETAMLKAPPFSRPKRMRRPLLVAAIIALTLLLVGCAVAYALRLQDMSIGREAYTQRFDEEGKYLEEPVEKTKDILTMSGHSGDSIQQALTEWHAFLASYDPEGKLMTNDPNLPEIPDPYEYTYSCYTQEMVEKVDEISQKYDLKLLGLPITIQRWQDDIFLTETGIGSLTLPSSTIGIPDMSGIFYLPCNFKMEFDVTVESSGRKVMASYFYTRKDYFPREHPNAVDLSEYTQWDMAAPDGTPLLLALSSKGHGYILAEKENSVIQISVNGNFSSSAYPDESEIITKSELEELASAFDYSIQPQTVDQVSLEALLVEAEAAYQAEHAYVPEVYGSFNAYLLDNYKIPNPNLQYTFFDLTGDGEAELLIGANGAITQWLTVLDDQVVPNMIATCYLCEGYVLEYYETVDELSSFERRNYVAPKTNTAYFGTETEHFEAEMLAALTYKQGKWYQTTDFYGYEETEITATEAQSIIAQHPRIQMDWKPLMEYPLDGNGSTLGDYMEANDIRVSDDELLRIYKDYLNNKKDLYYTHYRILDINADGVLDLLVSGDGEKYWNVLTYRYGIMTSVLMADFYLCEDGILERTNIEHRDMGVEVERHRFMRLRDMTVRETLAFAAYNKAADSWEADYDATPMEKEKAENILEKYPRVDQGMRPISELLD